MTLWMMFRLLLETLGVVAGFMSLTYAAAYVCAWLHDRQEIVVVIKVQQAKLKRKRPDWLTMTYRVQDVRPYTQE